MKRFLGVLFLSVILAKSAFAVTTIPWTKEGCESVKGEWITAHSPTDEGCDAAHCNGLNFCRSVNVAMNWWSAVIWCRSLGRELVDLETACPKGLASSGTCANLKGRVSAGGQNWYTWTSTPFSATHSYMISSGTSIGNLTRDKRSEVKAMCK